MIRKILLVVLVFTCATFVCANSPKSVLELLKNNNSYLQINNNPYLQKRDLENSYAMEIARRDSRFVEFEKTFDVTNVRTEAFLSRRNVRTEVFSSRSMGCCVYAEDYFVYATPKAKSLLDSVLFRFNWMLNFGGCLVRVDSLKFKESPLEDVKLYERIEMAVRKNPLFVKFLHEIGQRRIETFETPKIARIRYDKSINDGMFRMSIDDVWKDIGLSGKYVGTLQVGHESVDMVHYGPGSCGGSGRSFSFNRRYDCMLFDNGDVLVSYVYHPDKKNLLGIPDDIRFWNLSISKCKVSLPKKVPFYAKNFYCGYSTQSRDYCEETLSRYKVSESKDYLMMPKLCNYLVIRRNGKIEYGFNRKTP